MELIDPARDQANPLCFNSGCNYMPVQVFTCQLLPSRKKNLHIPALSAHEEEEDRPEHTLNSAIRPMKAINFAI